MLPTVDWYDPPTGACEGTLSCSTCHLIVDEEWFGKIPDPLTEEEQDMLDLAYGLTDTYVHHMTHTAWSHDATVRLRLWVHGYIHTVIPDCSTCTCGLSHDNAVSSHETYCIVIWYILSGHMTHTALSHDTIAFLALCDCHNGYSVHIRWYFFTCVMLLLSASIAPHY